jgi:hypothetical protein
MAIFYRPIGVENINDSDKADVLTFLGRCGVHDIDQLFKMYHKYVDKLPSDRSCPSCVQHIIDFWKRKKGEWETNT